MQDINIHERDLLQSQRARNTFYHCRWQPYTQVGQSCRYLSRCLSRGFESLNLFSGSGTHQLFGTQRISTFLSSKVGSQPTNTPFHFHSP